MAEAKDLKKFYKAVGLSIRARRLELGWALEETEEYGYPSWRHLQKVEAGKNITLETLFRISAVLKADPKSFL